MIDNMDKIESVLSSRLAQDHLIWLYQQSQTECSKNGRLSMEIGASREKDLIAVLHHHMGDDVRYNSSIHAPEDLIICGQKYSIKHLSCGIGRGGFKWKWTSDAQQAMVFKKQLLSSFADQYYSNMLIVYIDTKKMMVTIVGVLKEVIVDGVRKFQDGAFISRVGTNNRGVEYSACMIRHMLEHASFKVVIEDAHLSLCDDPIKKRIRMIQSLYVLQNNSIRIRSNHLQSSKILPSDDLKRINILPYP